VCTHACVCEYVCVYICVCVCEYVCEYMCVCVCASAYALPIPLPNCTLVTQLQNVCRNCTLRTDIRQGTCTHALTRATASPCVQPTRSPLLCEFDHCYKLSERTFLCGYCISLRAPGTLPPALSVYPLEQTN
jgi:hypothetical protein